MSNRRKLLKIAGIALLSFCVGCATNPESRDDDAGSSTYSAEVAPSMTDEELQNYLSSKEFLQACETRCAGLRGQYLSGIATEEEWEGYLQFCQASCHDEGSLTRGSGEHHLQIQACENEAMSDGQACQSLGFQFLEGQDRTGQEVERSNLLSFYFFQTGCAAGDAHSCSRLGYHFFRGIGVAEDPRQAARYSQKGCEAGDPSGCENLATFYAQGIGVDQDLTRAAELLEAVCEASGFRSCVNLGMYYLDGLGVPADPTKAAQLFQKGCNAGEHEGCFNLARIDIEGRGAPQDFERGLSLLEDSCLADHWASCNLLGLAILDGQGVPADAGKAVPLFRKSCRGGDVTGCAILARLYAEGIGVTQDLTKTASLLDQNCEAYHIESCNDLGYLYFHGIGVPESRLKAAEYFRKVCTSRDQTGCSNLESLLEDTIDSVQVTPIAECSEALFFTESEVFFNYQTFDATGSEVTEYGSYMVAVEPREGGSFENNLQASNLLKITTGSLPGHYGLVPTMGEEDQRATLPFQLVTIDEITALSPGHPFDAAAASVPQTVSVGESARFFLQLKAEGATVCGQSNATVELNTTTSANCEVAQELFSFAAMSGGPEFFVITVNGLSEGACEFGFQIAGTEISMDVEIEVTE